MKEAKAEKISALLKNGPMMDIYSYERAKLLYLLISENSKALNDAGFGAFFGAAQRSMLTEMILYSSRLFDNSRLYKMKTIPYILKELEKCNPDELPIPSELIASINSEMPTAGKADSGHDLSAKYKRLKNVRDKQIAHSEDVSSVDGPTLEMIDDLIEWAKTALDRIGRAVTKDNYVFVEDGGTFVLSADAYTPTGCAKRILKALGVEIKK
jgi:hypothetical protein